MPDRLRTLAEARQLDETLQAVRLAPLPVLALATLDAASLTRRGEARVVLACFAALLLLACAAALAARLFRPLDAGEAVLRFARRLAPSMALAAGVAFGLLPLLLLPGADGDGRLALALSSALALAAAPLLGPMPAVGPWFLAPILAGSVCGATGSSPAAMVLPLGVGGLAAAACLRLGRASRWRIVEALRVEEREDMLDLVGRDGDGAFFWRTDAAGRLRDVSEHLATVAAVPAERLEGKPFEWLFSGRTPVPAAVPAVTVLLARLAARQPFQGEELVLRSAAGLAAGLTAEITLEAISDETIWWRLTGKPLFDAAGVFVGYRGIGWNVSALRQASTRIAHLVSHDQLTGLHSRDSFELLAAAECGAATPERPRALLLCNLDNLQSVNLRLGHAGGNAVLRAIASRLGAEAPRGALLARLNGDEFALLYAPLELASAETLARRLLVALKAPIAVEGTELSVGVSIGVAAAPRDADGVDAAAADGTGAADGLIRRAGLALRRAKSDGKGRMRSFAPELEQAQIARRDLEVDIKLALARGEFALHYQPLLDLEEGRIVSYEALIRWTSPTRGPVPPGDFIAAAEDAGLVVPIGRFVLAQACRDAVAWREPARVAVNISPQHLRAPEFMTDVALALRLSGLPPWRLEIEVTEGVLLGGAAVDTLNALRAKGITVALDDFGTGYSSLNYLVDFPVDKIKIDRSFVTGMTQRPESDAVVDAMLTLARRLGIRVTAEGVETAEQALALKLKRCDDIQGWLLSKAVPAADVDALAETGPRALRLKVPALFESRLAAAIAMRSTTAA